MGDKLFLNFGAKFQRYYRCSGKVVPKMLFEREPNETHFTPWQTNSHVNFNYIASIDLTLPTF